MRDFKWKVIQFMNKFVAVKANGKELDSCSPISIKNHDILVRVDLNYIPMQDVDIVVIYTGEKYHLTKREFLKWLRTDDFVDCANPTSTAIKCVENLEVLNTKGLELFFRLWNNRLDEFSVEGDYLVCGMSRFKIKDDKVRGFLTKASIFWRK